MLVVFKLFNMFLSSVQSHASCKLWNGIVLYFIHDIEWWRCVKASYYITIYTHIFYCACQFTQCTFFCFFLLFFWYRSPYLFFSLSCVHNTCFEFRTLSFSSVTINTFSVWNATAALVSPRKWFIYWCLCYYECLFDFSKLLVGTVYMDSTFLF